MSLRNSLQALLLLLLFPFGAASAQDLGTAMPLPDPGQAPASPYRLRLVGPEGRPLDGVELRVRVFSGSRQESRTDVQPQLQRTDGQGVVEVFAEAGATLEVAAAGYLPRSVSLKDAGDVIHLALDPSVVAGGRVVTKGEEAPSGLSGVDLEAWPDAWQREAQRGGDLRTVRAQSDSEGRFLLEGLVPGTLYHLVASRSGYARTTLTIASARLGEPPEDLKISLVPGVVGFGYVLNLDERPIAGARVRLKPERAREAPWPTPGLEDSPEAATDKSGLFELRDLPPGMYTLTASAPGFSELIVPGVGVLGAGRLDLGTILLDRGNRLTGRVSDPDGQPVAGARISWRRMARATLRQEPAVTGSDGTFTLDGLPAESLLEMEITGEGFQPRHLRDVPSDQGTLDVVLDPGVTLRGQVVDAAGEPASGVSVELSSSERGRVASTSTDGEGRFEWSAQAPGKLTLSARGASGYSAPRELVLRASESPVTVRLELRAGATVSGWVLDPDGAGVAGTAVQVERDRPGALEPRSGSGDEEWTADDEGRFTVSGLAEGRYRLTARHADFVPVTTTVEVGGEESYPLDLEFSERRNSDALRLVGRVVDTDRRGVQGADVLLTSIAGGKRAQTVSRGDGSFEVRATAPGEHVVEVRHPMYALRRTPVVDLGHEAVEEIVVELQEGGSIHGSILGLEPAQLAHLQVLAASRGLSRSGEVAYDGSYRLTGLAAGEWSVRALADGRRAEGTATLEAPGERVLLDLRFEKGFRLDGHARMDGDPLTGAQVEASCHGAGYHSLVSTDGEGHFELRDVPQGDCILTLSDASRAAFVRREMEVRGDTDVELDVAATAMTGDVLHLHGLQPIAGATVELLPLGDTMAPPLRWRTVTDSQGRFRFAVPDRGTFTVRASKEGFAFSERQIDLGGRRELRLLLEPEESAVLYVIGPEGDVPSRVEVEVRSPAGGSPLLSRSYQPELDGKVTIRSLPAGFWTLFVTGEGLLSQAEVRIPGEPVVIVLGSPG